MDPARILREEPEWAAQLERRHGPVQGEGRVAAAAERPSPATLPSTALLTAADLRRVRLPVLLAYGDRDVFVPPIMPSQFIASCPMRAC